jgi:hypothetical protein
VTALSQATLDRESARLLETAVRWLETCERPDDLFTSDVFVDFTLPHWRIQAAGTEGAFAIREQGHPSPGRVRVEAVDATSRGFLLQIEERWEAEGQQWYCRELIHCIVEGDRISELSIYCTGDWDENVQRRHAEQVRLLRP